MSLFHLYDFSFPDPLHPATQCPVQDPKRPNDTLPEDDKDVDHLEEDEDLSDKEEEIPAVEKAVPQAQDVDTSQPRPSLPKCQRPKPSQYTQLLYHSACLAKDGDLSEEVIVNYGVYSHVQWVHAIHTL